MEAAHGRGQRMEGVLEGGGIPAHGGGGGVIVRAAYADRSNEICQPYSAALTCITPSRPSPPLSTSFVRNIAHQHAGAVECVSCTFVNITDCSFVNNTAPSSGALTLSYTTGALVSNSIFSRNTASRNTTVGWCGRTSSGGGGAVCVMLQVCVDDEGVWNGVDSVNTTMGWCGRTSSGGGGAVCVMLQVGVWNGVDSVKTTMGWCGRTSNGGGGAVCIMLQVWMMRVCGMVLVV